MKLVWILIHTHVGIPPITVRGGINAGYWKEGSVKGSAKRYNAEVSLMILLSWAKMLICASGEVTNVTTMDMMVVSVACLIGG